MLDADTVYVWRVELADLLSAAQLDRCYALLSPEERQRADAFRGAGLRRDYILAHAALRSVLGLCLGVSPDAVPFAPEAFARSNGQLGSSSIKPALMPMGESGQTGQSNGIRPNLRPDLRFNLSHTRGAALIGVAIGRELGVDIEWQRPMEDLDAMAAAVMSPEELVQWLAVAPTERIPAFYHLWTRKEAYLKAIGLGLYRSLQEVTMPVSARQLEPLPMSGRLVRDSAGEGVWTIADIAAGDGYSASICCEGAGTPALKVEDLSLDAIA
jgi:4'-phosphopantetheinyl transferase